MLVKGTCQKQNLFQNIRDAILSAGTWTEISSNRTNDFKWVAPMTDGLVFKSPPIGTKGQCVFLNMKSLDLSVPSPATAVGNGGNHLLFWLADDYTPNPTSGVNGAFINRSGVLSWCFAQVDYVNNTPMSLYDYHVDIEDHRILIVIEKNSANTTTYPQFIYIGYPDPTTNIEGSGYTNQFIIGTNINNSNNYGAVGAVHWHKASNGFYNKLAVTNCNLNASNPNPMGLYLLTPITVTGDGGTGVASTGPLGVLSGLFGMPNTNIVNGDTITIGSDIYRVFNLSQFQINGSSLQGGAGSTLYYYSGLTPTIIAIKIN